MTTKPKPRRFRLLLSDGTASTPAPSVAPLVAPASAATQTPAQTLAQTQSPAQPAGTAAGSPAPARPARTVTVVTRPPTPARAQPGQASAPPPAQKAQGTAAQAGMTPATPANTPPPGTGTMAANAGLADEDADDKHADQAERARLLRHAERAPRSALHDRAAASGTSAAGNPSGRPAAAQAAPHSADVEGAAGTNAEIEAIRSEGLSARQLRMAMRVAQRHGIKATSGLEALRLLRKRGIDPFERSALLDAVQGQPAATTAAATDPAESGTSRALTTTEQPPLPRTFRQPSPPAQAEPDAGSKAVSRRQAEIAKIQRDIASRRRRRLALLAARLMVFVLLPTFLAGWYFYRVATPLYATHTDFVIQQADASNAGPPGLGGLFSGTGLATSQDSVTVQSYLQSREAMRRLDAEEGFKAHFQDPRIDPLRRLAMDASDEAAYRLYSRHVQISYDPTEGVVRMEVIAADPETSERFARALIRYAEEQVDRLTQRLRENQMRDAQASFERAEERTVEAQMRVLEMQERFQVLSSEVEVSLLTQQITTLEGQLNQERLSLEDLLANPRPNAARVAQAERRIAALEGQVTALRGSLTQGGAGSASLARVQREMIMAEADVQTRQLLLAQSLQQLEAARIEAARQVRYLSMGVSPIAPDESTYPRRFENTALAFLIFAGVYLMISMTVSILREQVTS